MTTVIKIVSEYLKTNGFDGLVQPMAECGCLVGDLAPCCDNISQCKPGYKVEDPNGEPSDWLISTVKPDSAALAEQRTGGRE